MKTPQRSYPFLGYRSGLSMRRSSRSFSYTFRYGWRMVGFDHPHHPLRMTDGGLRLVRPKKKQISAHNGVPTRAKVAAPSHKDHAKVHGYVEAEDTKGSAMNCESSRNLSAWRKGFSSPGVMKPGTIGPESVLPAQRNVLNERGRLQPEGTQQRPSIRLVSSTFHWQSVRPTTTPWVCVFPVFPTNKKNEPQFVLQT